ncbi:MAG: hypothetical protein JST78_04090 [Bacteroidetes bacterium]|nr:hypothetical protein [Bacteroidota bacterium]
MEIVEVNEIIYGQSFAQPSQVFNSAAFNALNAYKCEQVHYLLFKDSKVRLGLILGVRQGKLVSPFSAPFGGFEATSADVRLQTIDWALEALTAWAIDKKYIGIRIVQPPFIYGSDLLNKMHNCLYRNGFVIQNIELNYQFETSKFTEDYAMKVLWYNARKNYKRSLQAGLNFVALAAEEGQKAYEVIALNRSQRGFPLRMTWAQVQETMQVVPVDFFLVKKETDDIAAAVVFHVADGIVQVVYWGDLPAYAECKTMNFLSYHLFEYYQKKGIRIIDIGPSTENSIPNHGLCEFKESIGCSIGIKTEFYKSLS